MPAFNDRTNQKIGRVKVLSVHDRRNNQVRWNCKCDCGTEFVAWTKSFKTGDTFECKECRLERRRGPDLTGKKYGRWTVVGMSRDCRNKTLCKVICECGNHGEVPPSSLGTKKSMSCGCWGRKMKSKWANPSLYPKASGISQTKFYSVRQVIIEKCYNPNWPTYDLYGAKGIKVCDLWLNSARDMYDWALQKNWEIKDILCIREDANEFNPETTYIISNSQFRSDTSSEKAEKYTYNGQTKSIAEWAKYKGVHKSHFRQLLRKKGSIHEVLKYKVNSPLFKDNDELKNKVKELYASGLTQSEISKHLNHHVTTIRYHLLQLGVELRDTSKELQRPRKNLDNEKIMQLYGEGTSMNEIARRLNVTFPCIKYRINKMNGLKRDRSNG